MKILQSLWTQPLKYDLQRGRISGGWPTWKHYWYSWVLSAWQAHLTHGRVDLVTDFIGATILVEALGLPFHTVSTSLDGLTVHPALWAYGKIVAYDELAGKGEHSGGFLHIDSDVYLWKPLPKRVTQAAIAAQSYEWAEHYPPFHDIYTRPRKTLEAIMKRLPSSWHPHANDDHAINMGVFGGNDLDTLIEYCRQARDLVEHPDNRPGWQAVADSGVKNIAWSNMLIEQQTAYCVARQRGAKMTLLFEKDTMADLSSAGDALGYTHIMAHKKLPADHDLMQRLERRVRETYPKAWQRIEEGFAITGHNGSHLAPNTSKQRPSLAHQAANVLGHAARGTASIAKTTLGIGRATDAQVEARLNVCRQCPGGHAVFHDGDVHTCGPMLASMRGVGEAGGASGGCGCILHKKARDLAEDCPFRWWPK